MTLLPIAEAQARLLAAVAPVEIETASLARAAGRWASADILARRTQPAASRDSSTDWHVVRF